MLTLTIKYKNDYWKEITKVVDWITEIKNEWDWKIYIHKIWWAWYRDATKWLNDKQAILTYEKDEEYYKRQEQIQNNYDKKVNEMLEKFRL